MSASGPPSGMEPTLTEALTGELKHLRKGPGLTYSKLRNCPTLLSLDCIQHDAEQLGLKDAAAAERPLIAARRCLERLLDRNGDMRAMSLRNAFALDPKGNHGSLTSRRSDFALVHRISADTVRKYEDERLQHLIVELIELDSGAEINLRLRPEEVRGTPPAEALLFPLDESRYSLRFTRVETEYRFDRGRVPSHMFTRREVQALKAGVQEFEVTPSYSGGFDAVSIEGIEGCSVSAQPPGWAVSENATYLSVQFDRPLVLGEIYQFSYLFRFNPHSREPHPYLTHTLMYPTDAVTLAIRFAPDVVPEVVWPFQALSLGVPESRSRSDPILPSHGYVRKEFSRFTIERVCGLQWTWTPSNLPDGP